MDTASQVQTSDTVVRTLPPVALLTTFDDPDMKPGFGVRFLEFMMLPLAKPGQTFRSAALAFANEVRKVLGLPPATRLVEGVQGDPTSCVIAATILEGYDGSQGTVAVGGGDTHVGGKRWKHSAETVAFIQKFDGGEFDDLIVH